MLTDSDVLSSAALGVAPPGAWRGCACASVNRFGCEVRLRDPCAVLCNYPVCVPAPPGPLPPLPPVFIFEPVDTVVFIDVI